MIAFLVPVLSLFSVGELGVGHDRGFGLKFLVGFIGGVAAFVASASATIRFMLNTRWPDAASIALRFLVVFFLTVVALNATLAALLAVLRT